MKLKFLAVVLAVVLVAGSAFTTSKKSNTLAYGFVSLPVDLGNGFHEIQVINKADVDMSFCGVQERPACEISLTSGWVLDREFDGTTDNDEEIEFYQIPSSEVTGSYTLDTEETDFNYVD